MILSESFTRYLSDKYNMDISEYQCKQFPGYLNSDISDVHERETSEFYERDIIRYCRRVVSVFEQRGTPFQDLTIPGKSNIFMKWVATNDGEVFRRQIVENFVPNLSR